MTYLLDTNVFIQAKKEYFDFEDTSAFLKWLELKNQKGIIRSIDKVREELQNHEDILSRWSKNVGKSFFETTEYPKIFEFVNDIRSWFVSENYPESKISEFGDCADIWLIAHASICKYTVVSLEGRKSRGKIKIPVVCDAFNVPCITTDELLRLEKDKI